MKIVTGASGMLGAHFLLHLAKQNEQVVGLKRESSNYLWVKDFFQFSEPQLYQGLWDKIIWRNADMLDELVLEEALQDATEVYHCAASVGFNNSDQLITNNVTGTENLVNVLIGLKQTVSLLHVSSIAALGKPETGNTVTVNSEWKDDKKNSKYSISKYYSELEVWRGQNEGLKVTCVLPGVIVGCGPKHSPSLAPFVRVEKGKKYISNGMVGLVSANDVARLSIQLVESNQKQGERWLLVSENMTFLTFFKEIAKAYGRNIRWQVLTKSQLKRLAFLERITSFFTRKNRKLIPSVIDSLTGVNSYDGTGIEQSANEKYCPISKEIEKVVAWRKVNS